MNHIDMACIAQHSYITSKHITTDKENNISAHSKKYFIWVAGIELQSGMQGNDS